MSLSLKLHQRVGGRAAGPRWIAPAGLALITLLGAPNLLHAQISGLPSLPPLAGSGCSAPSAATAPFLQVFVNGACTDLSSSLIPTAPGVWNLNTTLSLTNATVKLNAQFQSDPFISFSAATTNVTPGTISYAFLFGTPVLPGMYTSASSSGGVSVSPGAGQNTTVSPGTIYPAFISGYGTNGPFATNLNVDVGTTACVATGTATATCNFGTNNSAFSPTFFDNLEALLTYNQNDIGSAAGFSGRIDLNAESTSTVPEPTELSMLVTGLFALGGVLRVQRRRA